jgi:hypothetical protein
MFLAADLNLATHMETGLMAAGGDWPAVARETWAWAAQRGLLDPADAAPPVGARPGDRTATAGRGRRGQTP